MFLFCYEQVNWSPYALTVRPETADTDSEKVPPGFSVRDFVL
jgi:hypothetical protein